MRFSLQDQGWKEIEYAIFDGRLEGRVNQVSYGKWTRGTLNTL